MLWSLTSLWSNNPLYNGWIVRVTPQKSAGGMVANVQLASFVKNVTQARAVGHVEDSCFRGPDSCLPVLVFEFAPHYEGP
jgi:hypothetical protein